MSQHSPGAPAPRATTAARSAAQGRAALSGEVRR